MITPFFLLIAAIAGSSAIYLAYAVENEVTSSLFASIGSSFLFLTIIELAVRIREAYAAHRFRIFFGRQFREGKFFLVFPTVSLSQDARETLSVVPAQQWFKPKESYRPTALSSNSAFAIESDVEALAYVGFEVSKYSGKMPEIKSDEDAEKDPTNSFISFGYLSNLCTWKLINSARCSLFETIDNNKITKSESINVESVDGKNKVVSSGEFLYGLIIKHTPNPEDSPERIWYFCAGLGVNGTNTSSHFLADSWKKLLRKVGKKDYLAIVAAHKQYPKEGSLVYLRTPQKVILDKL
jgi:hypothetical protein